MHSFAVNRQKLPIISIEREWVEKNLKMADDAPRMSLEEIVNKITLPAACPSSGLAELTDTKPVDEAKWEQCKSDYNSAWGSTDVRYSRTNVPAKQVIKSHSIRNPSVIFFHAGLLITSCKTQVHRTVDSSISYYEKFLLF